MTTVRTCTEPKDAWGLVSHVLGNKLLVISASLSGAEESIPRVHAELVGDLHILIHRMNMHNHPDDASKIQQILDMVVSLDVTKREVRDAIYDKNNELNPSTR